MPTNFISFRSSRLSYSYWGSGNKLLFCFHGYGEAAASFAWLEGHIGHEFTMVAIDMPFHGSTEWEEGLYFDPEDLLALMMQMAETWTNGHVDAYPKWWLLGYSMGGRIALQLLEMIPDKIERLVLVAPDGLIVNPWYRLATRTRAGNLLFDWTMRHPGWFFLLLRIGNRLKLVNKSIYKFTLHYIDDKRVREDLYKRWTTMRGFKPRLGHIKSLIHTRQIPVRLLHGQYDRIILRVRGEKFIQGIEPWCKVVALPAGHRLLEERNAASLISFLKE